MFVVRVFEKKEEGLFYYFLFYFPMRNRPLLPIISISSVKLEKEPFLFDGSEWLINTKPALKGLLNRSKSIPKMLTSEYFLQRSYT
jgi:hypothetical protein